MRRIDVDEEVYSWLEQRARGFERPNEVLRRELFGADQVTTSSTPPAKGALWRLLEAGLLQAGDGLHHTQPRKGRKHTATVEADGRIRTSLGLYEHPSRALGDLVGTSISGPAFWIHDQSGKSLLQLNTHLKSART